LLVVKARTALVLGLFVASAPHAFAQVMNPPDPATMRVRLGPLWLNPRLALTNAGMDTNVFNAADTDQPQRDFTMTVTPSTDLWLRAGRTWINGTLREDIFWFKKFASERSIANTYRVAWLVPLTRVAFSVGTGWVSTRERPGFEIDARPRRHDRDFTGAAEVRALSRTLFGVRGIRRTVEFEDAVFLGSNLREALTRTSTSTGLTIRHELTPLTTLAVGVTREQDRFDFSPLRDSSSSLVDVGLDFDPFALINGSARIGFRNFNPVSTDLPGYAGMTAAVDLAYVARDSTRMTVQATRDVQYSFDINQPYYLQSGMSAAVAQQIYGPIEVEGRVGAQRLSYRTRVGAAAPAVRVDRVRAFGGGIGYRMSPDLRMGFNVDHQKRTSILEGRQYDGLRYGIAVTYGR
jgi:hypothetical protein